MSFGALRILFKNINNGKMQDTAFALIVNTSTIISFFIHWDDYQCCDVILSDNTT